MWIRLIIFLGLWFLLRTKSSGQCTNETFDTSLPFDIWREHRVLSTATNDQQIILAKKAEILNQIDAVKKDISSEIFESSEAHNNFDHFIKDREAIKKQTKDPWRLSYGETKYVLDPKQGFVTFDGQILEVTTVGMRIFGNLDGAQNTEYFIVNFPYSCKAGESIDPSKIFMAEKNGTFSFVTEDGYAKSLPKINYGTPCEKPPTGQILEASIETSYLKAQEDILSAKDRNLEISKNKLNDLVAESERIEKQAEDVMNSAIQSALAYDKTFADAGNIDALRKMEERYESGDGVPVDPNMANIYHQKYEANFQSEADKIAEQARLNELAEARQKFLKNLYLADNKQDVPSILFVEKCYRYGIGVEKNIKAADEYHAKAISLGIPQQPNSSSLTEEKFLYNGQR
jgi:hypothetical protein